VLFSFYVKLIFLSVPALGLATLIFLLTAKIYDSQKRPDGEREMKNKIAALHLKPNRNSLLQDLVKVKDDKSG
jgi:hypothetical protein